MQSSFWQKGHAAVKVWWIPIWSKLACYKWCNTRTL